MSTIIRDGTLFAGGLGGRFARIGRILPHACYLNSIVTKTPPDRFLMEQHVYRDIYHPNGDKLPSEFYTEDNFPAEWFFGTGFDEQQTMDLRCDFFRTLRTVVGIGPRLMSLSFPLGGVMQAVNFREQRWWDLFVRPTIYQAARWRVDVTPTGTSLSQLLNYVDAVGLMLYWREDTSKVIGGGEDAAYWACAEPMLEIAKATGKDVYVFVRMISENGNPVPANVCALYYKFDKLVIWEDGRAMDGRVIQIPADAPAMKMFGKLPAKAA